MEELEKYERGRSMGKGAISKVANKLEEYTHYYIPFGQYVSETGHKNIVFDYESVLRNF